MMSKLDDIQNEHVEQYTCLFSESQHENGSTKKPSKANSIKGKSKKQTKINSLKEKTKTPPKVSSTKRRKEGRKTKRKNLKTPLEANKKHIKNLSDKKLTNDQINLLAKGLKYIPTPVTNEMQTKKQLLCDLDHFARRMCLQYIFFGENTKPHPFHVKSTCKTQIQPSVALESYLEEVIIKLAELELKNPKDNLNPAEGETLNTLKRDTNINLKKADKGTTSVVLNIEDKIKEGQTQLDNREHYRPLVNPLVFNSLLADSILETT